MIFKSYLLENNIDQVSNCNIFLFYGENEGLKKEFKEKLKKKSKSKVLIFFQEEIIKNQDLLSNEILNKSLFDAEKTIFIEQTDDKILTYVDKYENIENVKIFLFSSILNKKSKLRNFFEKSKIYGTTACYADNEITIKKIIQQELKNIQGLTPSIVNYIIQNTGLERDKVNNEIEKIKIFFYNCKIELKYLDDLLNLATNDDFNQLKDEALNGNKVRTNKLITDTVLEDEKSIYYLNVINQRARNLHEIISAKNKGENTEGDIDNLKPPLFWKDKPNFILQSKKWSPEKLRFILDKTYKLELELKSNSLINKNVLMKKLIVDICELANS